MKNYSDDDGNYVPLLRHPSTSPCLACEDFGKGAHAKLYGQLKEVPHTIEEWKTYATTALRPRRMQRLADLL